MSEIINLLTYLAYFLGICLVFIIDSRLLKKKPIKLKQTSVRSNRVYEHLQKLIFINFSRQHSLLISGFVVCTLLIFFIAMYLTLKVGILYSTVVSTMFASIPYFALLIRRRYIRVSISYDADLIITELANNYKIYNNNMIQALEATIKIISDIQVSKRIITRFVIKVKEYSNEEELQAAIDEFVYAIDTEWAKMLANNLYLSINSGLDVTNSLEDIVKELVIAKSNFEKTDRMNNENIMVGKYLTPILYIGSVYLAVDYFDYTIREFFYYQFKSTSGINYFVIIVILTVININFMYYIKNRKFDF